MSKYGFNVINVNLKNPTYAKNNHRVTYVVVSVSLKDPSWSFGYTVLEQIAPRNDQYSKMIIIYSRDSDKFSKYIWFNFLLADT